MAIDHNDTTALIEAMDEWFDILRANLNEPIPLKPASQSQLDRLAEVAGVDLPPDVIALYEYTNGAWVDDEIPLRRTVFLPSGGLFYQLPEDETGWRSWYSMAQSWRGIEMTGNAFDDVLSDSWTQVVPVLHFEGGHELAVFAAESHYQAVACVSVNGMHWVERRLADVFLNAIEMENRGLFDWNFPPEAGWLQVSKSLGAAQAGAGVPWNPDHYETYRGWIWE